MANLTYQVRDVLTFSQLLQLNMLSLGESIDDLASTFQQVNTRAAITIEQIRDAFNAIKRSTPFIPDPLAESRARERFLAQIKGYKPSIVYIDETTLGAPRD